MTIDQFIARQRLARAVQHDIEVVLAACLPPDWVAPAPAEPSPGPMCQHPLEVLVINMRTNKVSCRFCGHTLDQEEVDQRLNER